MLVGHLAAQDTTGSPLVFVLAGQSNMVGQGLTEELAPAQAVTPPNVTYFLGADEAGLFDRDRFGPEVSLAGRLAEAWPDRELVFVKHARGGTSLLAWAPEWDEARAEIAGVFLIETDDLTKHDDGVHYDTGGILELGRRFAEAYLAITRD